MRTVLLRAGLILSGLLATGAAEAAHHRRADRTREEPDGERPLRRGQRVVKVLGDRGDERGAERADDAIQPVAGCEATEAAERCYGLYGGADNQQWRIRSWQ